MDVKLYGDHMIDEKKEERFKRYGTWGFAIGGLALLSFVIWHAVSGLIGLGIFTVLGLGIVNIAPAVGRWFSAKRIQALEAVAAANPIEVQKSFLSQMRQQYEAAKRDLAAFRVEVANYESETANFIHEYGRAEAQDMIEQLDAWKTALANMERAVHQTEEDIQKLELEIKKWQAKFRMAKKGDALSKRLGKARSLDEDDRTAMDASFRAMQNKMNQSMVSMKTAVDQCSKRRDPIKVPKATVGTVASQGFTSTAGPQVGDSSSRRLSNSDSDNLVIPATIVAATVLSSTSDSSSSSSSDSYSSSSD